MNERFEIRSVWSTRQEVADFQRLLLFRSLNCQGCTDVFHFRLGNVAGQATKRRRWRLVVWQVPIFSLACDVNRPYVLSSVAGRPIFEDLQR